MVVRVRGKRVRDSVIIGVNYVAWAVISITLAWILLRGGG